MIKKILKIINKVIDGEFCILNGCYNCEKYHEDWGDGCKHICGKKEIKDVYEFCPLKINIIRKIIYKFVCYIIATLYEEEIDVNHYSLLLYICFKSPYKKQEFPFGYSEQPLWKPKSFFWMFWARNEYVNQRTIGYEGDSYEGDIRIMVLPFIWLEIKYSC